MLQFVNTIDNAFDVASLIRSKTAAMFTYDHLTHVAFTTAAIVRKSVYWGAVSVIFLGLLAYTLGQAVANYCGRHSQPTAVDTALIECPVCEPSIDVPAVLESMSEITLVDLGATGEELASLTSHQLRPICQHHGVKWRNAHGKGKHLTKTEMRAALVG